MLTACGIETVYHLYAFLLTNKLQQCLPLAVLKPCTIFNSHRKGRVWLQQCLPLAVLKQILDFGSFWNYQSTVATVLTACGIETGQYHHLEEWL